MHKSQNLYNAYTAENDDDKATEQIFQDVAEKSYDMLMKAVHLFEVVQDSINLIICNLNLGRFFRLSAHINVYRNYQGTKSLQMQKKMYQESFSSYHRALAILGTRKKNPELWDLVSWELSTSTFNLAKQMQDNGPADASTDELERDALDMLMKALKFCDLETNGPRQVLFCFRAGLIHHRLGSFYHQHLRNATDDVKKRTTLQLCRMNYEKAINLLESLREFKDYFQVQMERIALQEHLAEESIKNQQKIKNYQQALIYFQESKNMLIKMSATESILDPEENFTLLELFEKRLQFILKSLAKLSTLKASKKSDEHMETMLKKMFACTLRSAQKLELHELAAHLIEVLEKIHELHKA